MTAPNIAFHVADRHVIAGVGDRLAVLASPRPVDFARLVELSAAYAGALRHLGAGPGDRVVVGEPDSLENIVATLAVLRIGAVVGLGGEGVVDTAGVDYPVAIKAGRVDPAGAERVAADAIVLATDDIGLRHSEVLAILDEARAPVEPFTGLLQILRRLARTDAVTL